MKIYHDLGQDKLPQNKSVTGTEADLRKLSKEEIHDMLKKLGYDKTMDVDKLQRWEGVKILRDKSSKAAALGVAGQFKKFARGNRQTSKMQKENYQKDVNDIFCKQVRTGQIIQ